jgi:hypothetical protein
MLGVHADRLVSAPGVVSRGWAWLRACVPPVRLSGLSKTAAATAAGAPIQPGERVLVSLRQVSGPLVAATAHAVYHQDRPDHTWSRLGWEDVDQVSWDDQPCALTLDRAGRGGSPPVVLRLPRSAQLVDFARERVTATTLARVPLLCRGRVCGWLTARRRPGSDRVRWVLTLRDTAAAGDPALASQVAGTIAALEADLGLESSRPGGIRDGWWPQS